LGPLMAATAAERAPADEPVTPLAPKTANGNPGRALALAAASACAALAAAAAAAALVGIVYCKRVKVRTSESKQTPLPLYAVRRISAIWVLTQKNAMPSVEMGPERRRRLRLPLGHSTNLLCGVATQREEEELAKDGFHAQLWRPVDKS